MKRHRSSWELKSAETNKLDLFTLKRNDMVKNDPKSPVNRAKGVGGGQA